MPHIWLVGAAGPPAAACCPADPMLRSLEDLEGLLL
jgi:hypothetical protein